MGTDLKVTHNGREYAGQIMRIRKTWLGVEDHGFLTAFLHCEAASSGVGVGGYCLDTPVKVAGKHRREGSAFGMDHVMQLINTVGAPSWEELPGRHVIVLYEGDSFWGGTSVGLASLEGDRVFILKDHAEEWQARTAEPAEASA